jgi:oxygen-independent coproporphyrinogen-3 oxidase
VSIDLITGVPGMTMEILERTVEEVVGWRPEHISAYQLSIEEGSALARMIEKGEVKELEEEQCREQYDYLCRRLAEAGYHHYEISNWALPGHEAVHNSAYWTRHPYVGLGPGAHSLIGNRRSWNSQELSGWTSEGEDLTPEQIHTEEVMLLARTDRGPIPERDWFIADEIIPDLL